MSEPTYRVDLTHQPENSEYTQWKAAVRRLSDDELVAVRHGRSREEAFTIALKWVVGKSQEPKHPSSVYLSEDGDLLDPAEVHGV